MIYACIFPTRAIRATEGAYSAGVGYEVFELEVFSDSTYEVGSATASLLSTVHFSLVCRASSLRKDRKGVQHVWKFETRLF